MNTTTEKPAKPKIVREVVVRFYVMIDDWIQAGPFDTKEEAKEALKKCRETN